MKHFIDIKNTTFNVSDSVVSAITKSNLNFQVIDREGKKISLLDDSTLSFFLLVPIKSSTHRYIKIRESNKIRVNKLFYDFLVSCSKQRNVKKIQNTKTTKSFSLEKFYTKPEISDFCVNVFGSNIKVKKQDLIVEPSAGGGSFIKKLKELKCNTIFLDLAPENKQIKQANFLDWRPPKKKGKIHVIGNPPFGRQSSKCHKFIKHAAKFADTISFILPISFKKEYNLAKIPANLHLVKEVLLPKNSFFINNVTFALPTVFQIWEKRWSLRDEPRKLTPLNFAFVEKSRACFCVCRSGNAGYATTQFQNKKQSHYYFIKILIRAPAPEVVDIVNGTYILEREYNIGAPTISKQELTYYLNNILRKFSE